MKTQGNFSKEEFKCLLYRKELSRFILALLPCFALIFLFILSFVPTGMFGIGMPELLLILLIIVSPAITLKMVQARLLTDSLLVSEHNFPTVYSLLTEIKNVLDYNKRVDVYVIPEGQVNALAYRFFRTRLILLNYGLLEDLLEEKNRAQLKWVLARFVGSLKAKHFRLWPLVFIINSIEKLLIFNLFLWPYQRATQYSGDQIGLAVCRDLEAAIDVLNRTMVGNKLAKEVQLKGLLLQRESSKFNVFTWLANVLSSMPSTTNRYHNLLQFTGYMYPEILQTFIKTQIGFSPSDLSRFIPSFVPDSGQSKKVGSVMPNKPNAVDRKNDV